jgi:mono/diheme cytochrome c family protein
MKRIGEARALLIATMVSAVTLAGTFGFAAIMRSQFSRHNLPGITVAPVAPGTAALIMATANPDEGRRLFLLNCAHCHGDDARGDEGPDLHDLRKSDERIRQLVLNGIKGEMPSFAKKLNDSDVRALTAYLRSLHR